ncbi:hypothetical protein MHYP_G00018330 [Metynnis hypsauchen]
MAKTIITRPRPAPDTDSDDEGREKDKTVTHTKSKLQPVWDLLNDATQHFDSITQLLETVGMTYEDYKESVKSLSTSSLVIMEREPKDSWVNGYNPLLLRAWDANMDIQFILNPYSCIMYILSYFSKAEHEMSDYLKRVMKDTCPSSSESETMKQVMQAYSKNREVSAQEAVARTCSLKLKSSSRAVIFIPTDDNAVRMSLPMKCLQDKDPDDENVWMTGLAEKYMARPNTPEFENMCMAEFASEYRIVYAEHRKAGTGKSHLIKSVYAEATKILQKLPCVSEEADISKATVLLTAFTGCASHNINGKTLHALLKLPRSLKPPYQGLGNTLDEMRANFSNVQIIIIDEISMVSKLLFAYVNWRLQQIKGNDKPFGNVSIMAVGDFHQLPPLGKAKPLCVYEHHVLDFWRDHFKMITLTDIMRQKDDLAFAELLNRPRVKQKHEPLSDADSSLIKQVTLIT